MVSLWDLNVLLKRGIDGLMAFRMAECLIDWSASFFGLAQWLFLLTRYLSGWLVVLGMGECLYGFLLTFRMAEWLHGFLVLSNCIAGLMASTLAVYFTFLLPFCMFNWLSK